jgi:hypothetical protein
MNATPAPIAAAVMRARRKVIEHLTGVGATSAGAAVTYIPTRLVQRRALAYLQRRGVVNLAEGGRYWVNEAKAAEWRSATRRKMAIVLGGAVAAAAAVFAFTR